MKAERSKLGPRQTPPGPTHTVPSRPLANRKVPNSILIGALRAGTAKAQTAPSLFYSFRHTHGSVCPSPSPTSATRHLPRPCCPEGPGVGGREEGEGRLAEAQEHRLGVICTDDREAQRRHWWPRAWPRGMTVTIAHGSSENQLDFSFRCTPSRCDFTSQPKRGLDSL